MKCAWAQLMCSSCWIFHGRINLELLWVLCPMVFWRAGRDVGLDTDVADVGLETGLASRAETMRNSRQRRANPRHALKGWVFFITCAPTRGANMRWSWTQLVCWTRLRLQKKMRKIRMSKPVLLAATRTLFELHDSGSELAGKQLFSRFS